jgi:hypothetical protein
MILLLITTTTTTTTTTTHRFKTPLVCESFEQNGEREAAVPDGTQQYHQQVDGDTLNGLLTTSCALTEVLTDQNLDELLGTQVEALDLPPSSDQYLAELLLTPVEAQDTCSVEEYNSLTKDYDTKAHKCSLQQRYDTNLLFPWIEFKNKNPKKTITPESIVMDVIYPVNDEDRESFRDKPSQTGTQATIEKEIPFDQFSCLCLKKMMFKSGYEPSNEFLLLVDSQILAIFHCL